MDKVQIHNDFFIDYKGDERKFTLVAVSIVDLNCIYPKEILIGWSFCRPGDTYKAELGPKIAEGRARAGKGESMLLSHAGLATTPIIKLMLETFAEYIKQNPSVYIAGYSNEEKRWKEKQMQSSSLLS